MLRKLKKNKSQAQVDEFLKAARIEEPDKPSKKEQVTEEPIGDEIQSRMKEGGITAFEARGAIVKEKAERKTEVRKERKEVKTLQIKQRAESNREKTRTKLFDLFGNDNLTSITFRRTVEQAGIFKGSEIYKQLIKEFLPKFKKGRGFRRNPLGKR